MCWQMKETYQIILELTSKEIRWDTLMIAIAPGLENNQPCQTYSVCES